MNGTLTDRQLRFIFEYLIDQNASAAAMRAGYSEKSRASAAHDLMNNPAVQARLREELQSLLSELRCSALELMKERMRAAFFRAEKMFSGGWELRALEEMEPEVRAALEVSSVMRKSGLVLRVKQPDRDRALRALEKVHERLERLNEKYWDRLEREGKVKSLEEIEAMDRGPLMDGEPVVSEPVVGGPMDGGPAVGGPAVDGPAVDGPAVDGPMASGNADAVPPRVPEPEGDFYEKSGVFLGCGAGAGSRAHVFPAKTGVFSGSAAGAGALAGKFPEKTPVLSGRADRTALLGVPPSLPRPQASHWLLREPVRFPGQLLVA